MNKVELLLVAINPYDLHSTCVIVDDKGNVPTEEIPSGTQIDDSLRNLFGKITNIDISWITPKLINARNDKGVILTYSCLINTDVALLQPYLYDEIRKMDSTNTDPTTLELINKAMMQRY